MYDPCGECCLVPPLVSASNPVTRYCREPPMCNPCLPAYPKPRCDKPHYDCEHEYCHAPCRRERSRSRGRDRSHDRRYDSRRYHSPCDNPRHHTHRHHSPLHHDNRHYDPSPQRPDNQVQDCKPVRTKYVIPCYRYEDGRIEQYVPTRHGTLPKSAYARNGMQDQIHGYRGAQRYLCACENNDDIFVNTVVEPMRKVFQRVTDEVWPVRKKKPKPC